jgi:hypothetical protein
MKRFNRIASLICVFFLSLAVVSVYAQEPELPLTWKGEGKAKVLLENGIEELSFSATIHIDNDGWTTGSFSNYEGEIKIERFFYMEENDGARKVILVLLDNDDSNPRLFIVDGRILAGQFIYGEILFKNYVKDGSIEKGLSFGNKTAEEVYQGYMPAGLKAALQGCKPVGCLTIKGKPSAN